MFDSQLLSSMDSKKLMMNRKYFFGIIILENAAGTVLYNYTVW